MERTVVKSRRQINQFVARHDSLVHGFLDSFFHGRNVFLGYDASFDFVDEFESFSSVFGFHFQPNVTVLSAASRLPDVFSFRLSRFLDRFLVSNLRPADVSLNLEFSFHPVNQNFQMQLSHSGDDGFSRFRIPLDREGRIFLSQFFQCKSHFFLVCLGLGFYSHCDDGLRKSDLFQNYGICLIAQSVPGGSVFQADGSQNVSGISLFHLFSLGSMHSQQPADSFLFAG